MPGKLSIAELIANAVRPLNESKTDGEECRRGATPRKDVFSSGCVYCIQPFPIPNPRPEPLELPRSPPSHCSTDASEPTPPHPLLRLDDCILLFSRTTLVTRTQCRFVQEGLYRHRSEFIEFEVRRRRRRGVHQLETPVSIVHCVPVTLWGGSIHLYYFDSVLPILVKVKSKKVFTVMHMIRTGLKV